MKFDVRSLGSDLSDRDAMTRIVFGGVSGLPPEKERIASP